MLFLQIDTATEHASVCLTRDGVVVELIESAEQKNHASFIQPAIDALIKNAGTSLQELDAVAVTIGPGSYTGLRVGLASAKGICFALQKPLITVNTLQVMSHAALNEYLATTPVPDPAAIFCPLIDARRMEVFTATFNLQLDELVPPYALIITENAFQELYSQNTLVFSGSGREKVRKILNHPSIRYVDIQHTASDMTRFVTALFDHAAFSDLAYCAPLYVKEFFDTTRLKAGE